tara:strand:+ start:314 stop:652 length:339 start_codon:yes stop_codon:yes gene_type:complete
MGRWILGMDNSIEGKERMINHLLKCERGMKDTLMEIHQTACRLEHYLDNEKQHILLNEIYKLATKYDPEPSVDEKLKIQKDEMEAMNESIKTVQESVNKLAEAVSKIVEDVE